MAAHELNRRRRAAALTAAAALVLGACTATGNQAAPEETPPGPTSTAPTTPTMPVEPASADDIADKAVPGLGDPRIDVKSYDVTVRADPGEPELTGRAELVLQPTTELPLESFTLDLRGPEVSRASVNGEPATVTAEEAEITITPAEPLTPGADATVAVDYAGTPEQGSFADLGIPVGWQADNEGGWFTMSEPDGTSTWVPSNDHPSDKATWTITLDAPQGSTGVATGSRQPGPEAEEGRSMWRWVETEPVASYLVLAAIGDYELEERVTDGRTTVFAYPPSLPQSRRAGFDPHDEILDHFAELFGPYPNDDAGAIVVDTNLGLALESQGRPLFGLDAVGNGTVGPLAHELAHQWFGDSVTPDNWRDLWLNEGFATYADWLWRDHAGRQTVESQAASAARRNEGTALAVRDPAVAAIFHPVVYERGALTLHALRARVGDEAFFDILQRWAADQAGTSTDTEAFVSLASEVADEDLTEFFDAWLDGTTQPEL